VNLKPLIAVLLLACHDTRGEVDKLCNPDGTCDSPNLECVGGIEWAGVPMRDSLCKMKRRACQPRK
jgi:hypothetical protein